MSAIQSDAFDSIRFWDRLRTEKGWWHSFELPDGSVIEGVCDLAGLKNRIGQFPIPEDLRGKRVLDIGTWDGWFAFEMERRGAEVVAVDNWDNPRFHEMHSRLGSRVDYRQSDMYDLTPERFGRFDIVLFMGVLYHLKHPLLALERVCALTTEMAVVDSYILREEHRPGEDVARRPVMEFYETNEMGGQTDNWVAPSVECLLAFCRTAGFARVELQNVIEHSACIACYRKWPAPAADAGPAPDLSHAIHHTDQGFNFESRLDEYVSIWFDFPAEKLTLDDVRPQAGDFGVRPISVASVGESHWQANFKLPPGLTPGWHDVTVAVRDGLASNAKQIAVDVPLVTDGIELKGVRDGQSWAADQVDRRENGFVSLWVSGLPNNTDTNNLRVFLGGRRLKVIYIETRDDDYHRQINAEIPPECPRGSIPIGVAIGEHRSNSMQLLIL